ncbi:MAG: hypothetical protein ABIH63_02410 [archaeon]
MLTKDVLVGPDADPVFKTLVQFNVLENYFRRTVAETAKKGSSVYTKKVREGDEREKELIGILMLKHRRGIQSHSSGPLSYSKINLTDLPAKLVKESKTYTDEHQRNHPYRDGGYVVKEGSNGSVTISDKHVFHNYLTVTLKAYNKANPDSKIRTFSQLAELLVPKDFSSHDASSLAIGSKSQMALAAGDSYLIKQSVYDSTEVGKVVKVGKMLQGVEAEFFLYRVEPSDTEKYMDLKEEDFINPKEKVIGILRTYKPGTDKSVRAEYVITPKDIGMRIEMTGRYAPSTSDVKPLPQVTALAANY